MPFFIRKYFSVGPVRFNLSKSGIGTSLGVKGFRLGVRPDGRRYVHSGRYGLYYRQEIGKISSNAQSKIIETNDTGCSDTTIYKPISSSELVPVSKKDLVDQLNKSYKSFRFDYLAGILSMLGIILLWDTGNLFRIIAIILGVILTVLVVLWEKKRRTINIVYEFENNNVSSFEKIVEAFNNITENKKIWSLIDSRYLYNTQESKLNAGASSLINRKSASAGEGKPPWVKANISIPVIKTEGRSIYFTPDGIFVYDSGVGVVEYEDLIIESDWTRFIESNPPSDSNIVDHKWKYSNKQGGPDRRFNNNYKIPICLYGKIKISTSKGLLIYLLTSNQASSEKYCIDMNKLIHKSSSSR